MLFAFTVLDAAGAVAAQLELVDSGTGRTLMLITSKPKEIVVVGP